MELEELTRGIAKVRYTHDAMIDMIVQNPWISQNEIAAAFGYSPSWISQVITSDAFQVRLAARREEVIDPVIKATLEERFKALVHRSLQVLQEKLDRPTQAIPDNLVLKSVELGAKALGYGAAVHVVAPPPQPAADRLSLLSERLVDLLHQKRERTVEGEVIDEPRDLLR